MDRRTFLALTGPAVAAGLIAGSPSEVVAQEGADLDTLNRALRRFRKLPGDTSYLIEVGRPGPAWRTEHRPDAPMFVGSAVKTFILAKFLQDVEAGRLSEDAPVKVDNKVRSLSSPVFIDLRGTTPARSALEAMITHSDNTGTDIAIRAAGPERVRALIADAGLTDTRIPDSTRIMLSYFAGAPFGVDAGWAGMKKIMKDEFLGTPREAINDRTTMMSTAADFVAWYQRSLRGEFFEKPETLVQYKRIQAMANALPFVVPPDTPAYGKGGSIDWQGFHTFCLPGQMILGTVPVTFSFTVNWRGADDTVPTVLAGFLDAIKGALAGVKSVFG